MTCRRVIRSGSFLASNRCMRLTGRCMRLTGHAKHLNDADAHKGAVEDNRPPTGSVAGDRIGANVDDGEVANADEIGRTSEAPRDESAPLEERSDDVR